MSAVLLDCPMCGSPAVLDATGTSECYGHAWQTLAIECSNTTGQHCGMELSLQADFHNIRNSNAVLAQAWNSLER